jgi:putative PIN family toxin of toxin-antitoxin system
LRIVLDTNVLVSALLRPEGNPARILDLVLEGLVRLVVDARIFDEYAQVLARPKFGISAPLRERILEWIRARAEWPARVAASRSPLPDPDDAPFLETAQAAFVDALVTGNVAHFPKHARQGVEVLTPAQFMVLWKRRKQG